MARYAVYRLKSGMMALDCQADVLSHFKTRLAVPLLPIEKIPQAMDRLHPVFEVEGMQLAMATHLASAIPLSEFGVKIVSLELQETEISNALDMLLTGV
jgi:toxin CcdB